MVRQMSLRSLWSPRRRLCLPGEWGGGDRAGAIGHGPDPAERGGGPALALADADVKESEAVFTKTEQERSDGRVYYEMEFATAAVSYQCEVDAVTGAVVQYQEEPRRTFP